MNKVVQAIIDALENNEIAMIYKAVSDESCFYHFTFSEKNKVIKDLNIIAAVEFKADGVYVFVYDLLAMTNPEINEEIVLYCKLIDDKHAMELLNYISKNEHLLDVEKVN